MMFGCEDDPLVTVTVRVIIPGDDEETHVVIDALWNVETDQALMWCGLVVVFDVDVNPSADFYSETWRARATCASCRSALGLCSNVAPR